MLKLKFTCVVLVLFLKYSAQVDIECVPIKSCPLFYKLMKRPNNPDTIRFLQTSHCGYKFGWPLIYCPKIEVRRKIFEIDWPKPDGPKPDWPKPNWPKPDWPKPNWPKPDFMREVTKAPFSKSKSTLPDPSQLECGVQDGTQRITGGVSTELDEYPWMVILVYKTPEGLRNGCGGSLINRRYVLTAAHCVDKSFMKAANLKYLDHVILGEYDINNHTDCVFGKCADIPKLVQVKNIIPHEEFNSESTANDIALVELNEEIQYTEYIKPICLPEKNTRLSGNETFFVAGWGQTSTSTLSPVKLKAQIKYTRNCKRSLTKGQICAGTGDGKDSCKGDSGGPMMSGKFIDTDYVLSLMGVISYGLTKCGEGPGVYTYVPQYIDWIKNHMK